MKLRLVSDGTAHGTRVMDEQGNEIQGISAVHWRCDATGISVAEIKLLGIEVDVVGDTAPNEQRSESELNTDPIPIENQQQNGGAND